MPLRAAIVILPLAAVGALLSGCASTAAEEVHFDAASIKAKADVFREEGRDSLADSFADGVIDADDYDAAFSAFSECMTSRGYEVSTPTLSPADGLRYIISFRSDGKSEAELSRDRDECGSDLSEVEAMYTATTEQVMEPALRTSILQCMEDHGLKISAEARNYPAMVQSGDQSEAWHRGLSECLGAASQELYPELPYLPVGY